MISKTFNRYIWLLNILLQQRRLTFEEISRRWQYSHLSEGKPLSIRTFHQHRNVIAELFGVEIKCDTSTYEYYVSSIDRLQQDNINQWLLNSFTISNTIEAGRNMKNRILFETIPSGTEYLQTIIEAIQRGKELSIDYKPFNGVQTNYHLQPYWMKVFQRRWYVIGFAKEKKDLRSLALDRIQGMNVTHTSFVFPEKFNPEEYYAHTIGIFVNKILQPQKIIIRAYNLHVFYMRALPLHTSQQEINTVEGVYSDFQYSLCLNPELITQILSKGDNVEVLEPPELRDMITHRLQSTLQRYNPTTNQ